jgi:hypothetical protein
MRVTTQPISVRRSDPGGGVTPRVAAASECELESHQVMVGYAVSAKTAKAASQTSAMV